MRIEPHSKGLFARVTLPLAVFGLINQAARTVMAVIGPVLAVEFALSASELGMLAACMLAAAVGWVLDPTRLFGRPRSLARCAALRRASASGRKTLRIFRIVNPTGGVF
ncbi:MAG TPA: hypothetical protein VJ690_05890 [Burkholderiales bacterium]|nr:hypothetical protein [Burkholderiales bacterium]